MAMEPSRSQHVIHMLENVVRGVLVTPLLLCPKPPSEKVLIQGDQFMLDSDSDEDYERDNTNAEYPSDKEANGNLALQKIALFNLRTTKPFARIVRMISICHNLLLNSKHCSKRDIYYSDVAFFESQNNVDRSLDLLSRMLNIPRICLNVAASPRGLVYGNLSYTEDQSGAFIDCLCAGSKGALISPFMDFSNMQTNAKFLLVIEDDATFVRLIQDNFLEHNGPAILITARGYPDLATRRLVHILSEDKKIPSFALVDNDPHGIEILATYMFGSAVHYHDAANLSAPSMKWIGIHRKDEEVFELSSSCRQPLNSTALNKARTLLNRPCVAVRPLWRNELDSMAKSGQKLEIQSLCSVSLSFVSATYLPLKLRQRCDWI